MKKIPLTQGQFALVDDEDFEWLNQWKWYFMWDKDKRPQAMRNKKRPEKGTFYMHRVILDAPANQWVDHKDGNPLNNQRKNLRLCTPAQNQWNRKRKNGFRGVSRGKPSSKYRARLNFKKREISLGQFDTAEEAARAWDRAARCYYGEFARPNFPEEGEQKA